MYVCVLGREQGNLNFQYSSGIYSIVLKFSGVHVCDTCWIFYCLILKFSAVMIFIEVASLWFSV
jgi:hypothetical protein